MNECRHCGKPIELCERCGGGYIHSDTKFHSCADKRTMAQPREMRDADSCGMGDE